jgi:hypothetical protein
VSNANQSVPCWHVSLVNQDLWLAISTVYLLLASMTVWWQYFSPSLCDIGAGSDIGAVVGLLHDQYLWWEGPGADLRCHANQGQTKGTNKQWLLIRQYITSPFQCVTHQLFLGFLQMGRRVAFQMESSDLATQHKFFTRHHYFLLSFVIR